MTPKLRGKTSDKNWNSNIQVHTFKVLLDSDASASIKRKYILEKCHKTIKEKKNKWSTMAKTFDTD